jgi:hypothetical protein
MQRYYQQSQSAPTIAATTSTSATSDQANEPAVIVTVNDEPFVCVKASLVGSELKTQQGLFALRKFRKGDVLGQYGGTVYWDRESVPKDTTYVATFVATRRSKDNQQTGRYWVDGKDAGPPFLNKINDARGTPFKCNAKLTSSGRVVVTRTIQAGQEILMSYGRSYWKRR